MNIIIETCEYANHYLYGWRHETGQPYELRCAKYHTYDNYSLNMFVDFPNSRSHYGYIVFSKLGKLAKIDIAAVLDFVKKTFPNEYAFVTRPPQFDFEYELVSPVYLFTADESFEGHISKSTC
jgi:hypothetical protein